MTSTTGGGGGIRRVYPEQGYGYITPDDGGKDIYFKLSLLPKGVQPQVGQRVEFEAEMRTTGPTATRVAVLR